jgi:DNA polymerase III epsilon subunit-like protein
MKTRLIVIDTETGGLRADRHALLSLAAIDSLTGDCFHSLIRPAQEWLVEREALAVNGLSEEFLAERGRPEPEVMQEFTAWVKPRKGGILAGCNPAFDAGFLRSAAKRCGLHWEPRRLIDVSAAAWAAYERGALVLPVWQDGSPKLNLDAIAESLDLYRTGTTHDALEDALLTHACFQKLATL